MRNKWLIGIAVVVVVAAIGGGYAYYLQTQTNNQKTSAAASAAMQTAVARQGDISLTASGSGKIIAGSGFGLGFEESGVLVELNAVIGAKVKKGAVLARLQTTNSPADIAASISDAELTVIQAQQALDNLYTNAETNRTSAMNDIATYSQAVRDAQYQLENYTVPTILQDLDAIEAVDLMKQQLDDALLAFKPYQYFPASNSTRQDLLLTLNIAQSNYDAAVKRLNYEYLWQVAEANLKKARQTYENYKEGPSTNELTLAQATLANAQARLALAKEVQSIVALVAPVDGTIMDVTAVVGQSIASTTFITLANLDQTMVEVYLDETDLDKAVVGYQAEAVFDALPDQTFTGKVISVNPSLQTVGNIQAVRVIVQLDSKDKTLNLPVGLNAAVDIIAGQAKNAVLVPIEALRKLDEGEYAVFVVTGNKPRLRTVQVGLMDLTSAEIISGLQAGEVISTGITASQ